MKISVGGYMALLALAAIGASVVIFYVARALITAWKIMVNLHSTLHEAVAVLKEYRGDFQFLRQLQEAAGKSPNFGEAGGFQEPVVSVQGPRESRRPIAPFPDPLIDRFPVKPPEPDAEAEDADVTGNEEDMVNRERVDNLKDMGFDAEEPEVRPPGRTVDAG